MISRSFSSFTVALALCFGSARVALAFPPGAPSLITASPGNGAAVLQFTPPAPNGGAAVSGYSAICSPGAVSGTAPSSATTLGVLGLTNGTAYSCTVTAQSADGPGPASNTLPVTPGMVGFSGATPYSTGTDPRGIVVADFNNDGHKDMAVSNNASANVSMFLGNGTGGFSGTGTFAAGPSAALLASADFNGDGNADVAVTNVLANPSTSGTTVSVLLGDGAGGLGAPAAFATSTQPSGVAVGDFNGDGFSDLVTANRVGANVSLLLGNGSGGFASTTSIGFVNTPEAVIATDLSGDGLLDFAVASSIGTAGRVDVFLGNGNGTFQPNVTHLVGDLPLWMTFGDFNDDGRPDLATANFVSSNISVLIGTGGGGFAPATDTAVGANPMGITTGDFDRDGHADLAVSNGNSHSVSMLRGNGAGVFTTVTTIAVSTPWGLAAADFDADGRTDWAVALRLDNRIDVFLNRFVSLPSAPTVTSSTVGASITLNFTPPTFNGGTALTGYLATCNPGAVTGSASPTATSVLVSGLTAGTLYSCSVAARNALGSGPASNTITGTPTGTPSTTTVLSSPNPSFGEPVTFTAVISGLPSGPAATGIVTFNDGATAIPGCANVSVVTGIAQCYTSALGVGLHTVSAAYSGDTVYLPSQGTLAGGQTVNSGLSGTITAAATGLPLAGIGVRIDNAITGAFVESVLSGPNGVWRSSALPPGTYLARTTNNQGYRNKLFNNVLCAGACSTAGATLIGLTASTTVGGLNFELDFGASIAGTAVDDVTGLPADTFVNIYDSSGTFVTQARTNAMGTYQTEGLPPGTYYASATSLSFYVAELYNNIPCTFFSCTATSSTPIVLSGTATTSGVNFSLTKGGIISGSVTSSASGAGIVGVSVRIYNSAGTQVAQTTSGAAGSWSLSGHGGFLPPGNYFAKTSNSLGYVDERYNNQSCPGSTCSATAGTPIAVTAGGIASGRNFALDQGGSITGTVTASVGGSGLSGVTVGIFNSVGSQVATSVTATGGAWSSPTLVPGNYFLRTSNALGYVDERYDNQSCPGSNCLATAGTPVAVTAGTVTSGRNFALDLGGTISGVVTASDSGLPLAGVSVRVLNTSSTTVVSATTSATGSWSALVPAGTYSLVTANNLGYVDERWDNVLCPGSICPASGTQFVVTAGGLQAGKNFVLDRGGIVTGLATAAATGLPIAGLQITLTNPAGTQLGTFFSNASGIWSAVVPAGTYFARTFATGGYINENYNNQSCPGQTGVLCPVTASTPIVVSTGATTSGINFALDIGAQMSGTVLAAATGLPLSASVDVLDANGARISFVSTNASGVWTMTTGLPTGTYYARALGPIGFVSKLFNNVTCPGNLVSCGVSSGTAISLVAGITTTGIDFSLDQGGRISGTLSSASPGFGLSGATIQIYDNAGTLTASVTSSGATSWTLASALPAGNYFARTFNSLGYINERYNNQPCLGETGAGGCNVTAGTPIAVTVGNITGGVNFALDLGGRISGTITADGTGAPLSGVTVQAYDSGGAFVASGTSGSTGAWILSSGVPAGTYYLRTFNSLGYDNEIYDNLPCVGACPVTTGTPVSVTVGTTAANRNFALSRATTTTVLSSQNPATMGSPVTFTATIAGLSPAGSVHFKADGSTIAGCGAVTVSAGGAQCVTAGLTTGTHVITAEYSGSAPNLPSVGTLTPNQLVGSVVAPGDLVVREFRLRGPAGAEDEFIEIFNKTANAITVAATDGSPGYGIAAEALGVVAQISNGTVIPRGGFFLAVNSSPATGYSLSNYGGAGASTQDASWTTDIPDNTGVALFASTLNLDLTRRLDAVGFASSSALYREGSGLAVAGATGTSEVTYARAAWSGIVNDTGSNAEDVNLLDTNAATFGPVIATLGTPGPQNLASPKDAGLSLSLADPTKGATTFPNRYRVSSPTNIYYFRWKVTNTSGGTITTLRFRVGRLTTLNGPGFVPGAQADFRLITTLNSSPFSVPGDGLVVAQGLTLEPPPTGLPLDGGYNASVSLTIPGGLAPGASTYINLGFRYSPGSYYSYWVSGETNP